MSTITLSPGPSAPMSLTRRGRLVVSAIALVLLVVSAVLASGGGPATAGTAGTKGSPPAVTERVTVAPGETLWAIAQREAPGVDPRETIARILDLNALESSAVQAGRVLELPAG